MKLLILDISDFSCHIQYFVDVNGTVDDLLSLLFLMVAKVERIRSFCVYYTLFDGCEYCH